MGQNILEKTKITEVCITALRISGEDEFIQNWIKENGDGVLKSPHYQYLLGNFIPMKMWMEIVELPFYHLTKKMMEVLKSIMETGQQEPILIYKDMRINSGHKRAACLAYLGKEKIKAVFVPDDYKL